MRFSAFILTAVLVAAPGAGLAAPAPASGKLGTVSFTRLVRMLPAGKVWATYQEGLICATKQKLTGDGVQQELALDVYGPLFMQALAGSGRLDKDERPNLFAEATEAQQPVAYQVAALVHDIDLKLCGLRYGENNLGVKGSGSVQVQWQIYSPARREVVATVETTGVSKLDGRAEDSTAAGALVLEGAFVESARQLVASAAFKALMDAPPPTGSLRSDPGQQARISAVTGGPKARAVAESTGSVVLVILPGGHGSGVLVSADGYLLTNAHVVGQNKAVTIRWSDGFETSGEVVRVHAKRDVALVKTDPHGRTPLPTRFSLMQPGETVLAIGAPLERELQGTATRGVVSANRIMDGYSFIQSDVTVNPGNSGGALIDDKGYLVGLTDIGLRPDGVPSGLNFFIPVKDALDFLSLDLVAAPAPPARP